MNIGDEKLGEAAKKKNIEEKDERWSVENEKFECNKEEKHQRKE